MSSEIRITTKTVLVVVLLALAGWLVFQLRAVLLILSAALLLALALDPSVEWLGKRGIPRGAAVFLVFLTLGSLFLGFGALGVSPLIEQTGRFFQQLPELLSSSVQISGAPGFLRQFGEALAKQLAGLSSDVLRITWGAFSGALSIISVLVLSVYILLDFENLKRLLLSLLRRVDHEAAVDIINEIEAKLGAWFRGQLLLMLCIGVMTFVGLLILGVGYTLPLALIAGFLEIVPTLGPIAATIPAAIVGFATSPLTGLGVIALFILIQQLENNLIVPRVTQKAVGFNPLVTLIVLLIGGKLFGFAGVVLAVPTTLVVVTLLRYFLKF